jgi:hypothetical protein
MLQRNNIRIISLKRDKIGIPLIVGESKVSSESKISRPPTRFFKFIRVLHTKNQPIVATLD